MTHVVISGGSSGIGLELARIYLARGCRVSLIARELKKLDEARQDLAGPDTAIGRRIHCACADVSDAPRLSGAIRDCEAVHGPCDVLITSAGQVEPDFFDEADDAAFERQISVNLMGTVHAVRAVYPSMKARGSGQIMMISSAAALVGIPAYTAYCASKAALRGFAEALRAEAAPCGVRVCISFPPDTLTPQYLAEIGRRPAAAQALMGKMKVWPVERVARGISEGLAKDRPETHFGFQLGMLALFGGLIKPVLYRLRARKPDTGR